MRQIIIDTSFGIENLTEIDAPMPRPGVNEVRVAIEAVSLNYRDLLIIGGSRPVPLPLVPLSDAACRVVELGSAVRRWRIGDRVMPAFAPHWQTGPQPAGESLATLGGPLPGVLQEFAVFSEHSLVAIPDHLSAAQAATLPCAGVSAWNALFVAARIVPGSTVLLQGTGGVSLMALQLAKAAGAFAIVTSSSDEKLARVRAMGADLTINYRTSPDWGAVVRQHFPDGIDCVIEVGGSDTMKQSLHALRNGGALSYVGFLSGSEPRFDLGEITRKSLVVSGVRVGNIDSFGALSRAVSHNRIEPVVGPTFPFEAAGDALRAYRDTSPFGKVCITLNAP